MKDFVFKALVALVFTLGTYYSSGAVIGFGLLAVIATVFLVEFYLAFREQPKFHRVVNDIDKLRKYGFGGNPDWRPEVCALGEMENALGHIQKVGARTPSEYLSVSTPSLFHRAPFQGLPNRRSPTYFVPSGSVKVPWP